MTQNHDGEAGDGVAAASVWLLTVQWGSDGEGGFGWSRRSVHASRQRAQAAADELVASIAEADVPELVVRRREDEQGWFYTELDGGGYCPMAYSMECMPVQ